LPGSSLQQEVVANLWDDAVKLLAVGVQHGFMITRDELFDSYPDKTDRNFVYKREGQPCRICGTEIALALMQGRKLYWCPRCQQ